MQKRCAARCWRAECDRRKLRVRAALGMPYLLYWYKSTNTNAEGAASRWRAESGRGELLVRAALGVRQVRSLLALLVQTYKF